MKRMDPAEAERFLRERIAEMASHDDPTNDAAAAVLAALDAARAELAEIREAFDAPPYETHASMLTLLREAVRRDEESHTLTVQHQGRGELIARVAEAAGHEAQYPGQGLAEHVTDLRAEVERLRARTHEIQAQEMTKRAALDSEIAEWRTRYEAAKEWTETLPEAALSTSPWWFRSYAEKSALLRLVTERDEARAEVERLSAQRDAARARHTPDARMGRDDVRCGSCQEESWPCLTAVALGVTE